MTIRIEWRTAVVERRRGSDFSRFLRLPDVHSSQTRVRRAVYYFPIMGGVVE